MKNENTTPENEIENEFLSLEDEGPKAEIQPEIETETEPEPEEPKTEEPQTVIEPEPQEPEPQQPIEEPVKGKRGRKAGGKNKPKETEPQDTEQTTPEAEKTDESEELKKQIFGKKKEKEKEAPPQPTIEPPKQLFAVSGEMLLGAIDFTAPLIITTIGGMLDKDIKKIKVESLQLEEIEKKTLLPAAEAVAKEHIRLSAVEMLLSGLLIIYTGKIYQAVKTVKN